MSFEKTIAVGNKRATIQQAILGVVLAAGTLAVGAMAPNALSLLGRSANFRERGNAQRSFSRLVKGNFVAVKIDKGKKFIVITEKGKKYLQKLDLEMSMSKNHRSWDGKWRVIVFDISEKKRKLRDEIRGVFVRVGFKRLQDSVWVYPYDCEDFVALLKLHFFIGRDMLYMIVEKLENDRHLKEDFGLEG
jgi:DNA-binding transcriptional regulator PaaX